MESAEASQARKVPLNGWRAIALYLGRNQSTVKRWASEGGLPIHRPTGGAGRKGVPVYAFAEELDGWLRGRSATDQDVTSPPHVAVSSDTLKQREPDRTSSDTRSWMSPQTMTIVILALVCILGLGGATWWTLPRSTAGPTQESSEARDIYLRGVFHMNLRTADGIARAIDLFSETVAIDPGLADGHAALAQSYNLASQYSVMPAQKAYPLARTAATRALALDPDHSGATAALAFNTFYWKRDFAAAYELFERALRFDPNNADIHHWYALAIMHDRRFDIALREIDAAQRLSPTSPGILANKGLILHHAGRTEEALAILEPLAEGHPRLLSPISYLATIYLDTGRDGDFVRAYRQAADLLNDDARRSIAAAADTGLAEGGRAGMLDAMLRTQEHLHGTGQESAFKLALTAGHKGDIPTSLRYLEKAIERKEPGILGIQLELPIATLNQSPRFAQLVDQIGFSQK